MSEASKQPEAHHCTDCCCARSWRALGITEYTGKSIPEHIADLVEGLQTVLAYNGAAPDAVAKMKAQAAATLERLRRSHEH